MKIVYRDLIKKINKAILEEEEKIFAEVLNLGKEEKK